jgi:hypothetical protein
MTSHADLPKQAETVQHSPRSFKQIKLLTLLSAVDKFINLLYPDNPDDLDSYTFKQRLLHLVMILFFSFICFFLWRWYGITVGAIGVTIIGILYLAAYIWALKRR